MAKGNLVVVGDITADWFTWDKKEPQAVVDVSSARDNWNQHRTTRRSVLPGGAMLLARMLRVAAPGYQVVTPDVGKPATLGADKAIQSYCDLEKRDGAWRPQHRSRAYEFAGERVTTTGTTVSVGGQTDVLLIDDAGNGFRREYPGLQTLFKGLKPRWTVIKLSRPLTLEPNTLWDLVRPRQRRVDGKRLIETRAGIKPDSLVVIVNADDLRAHGVQITPRLSWERTAQDLVRHLVGTGDLASLAVCPNLIIRFGREAVLHYRYDHGDPTLYFEPSQAEGDRDIGRHMIGLTTIFTAVIAAKAAAQPDVAAPWLNDAIPCAMQAAIQLGDLAYEEAGGSIQYRLADSLRPSANPPAILACTVPAHHSAIEPGFSWRILETQGDAMALAHRVVRSGVEKGLAAPILRIGRILTVDRREIENIRSIDNLLREYMGSPEQKKPLSIAVFGPPGAGKSFLVKEIADSILNAGRKPGDRQAPMEFNLSQFTGLDHLTEAFHQVQDRMLKNEMPLVFFDEFDAPLNTQPLGWLKYFLAPMQDGEYRDDAIVHPLGRAIFVFAGGTGRSFRDFSAPLDLPQTEDRHRTFVQVKGPDFLSRLRGHIDILGPSELDRDDIAWPVRRAVLLRSQIERRAGQLMNSKTGELAIEDGVLRAFLAIPNYVHGARSMEAIVGMSTLSGQHRFTASHLPPRAQLGLHVDANEFLSLVDRERLPDGLEEKLAESIHAEYQRKKHQLFPRKRGAPSDPALNNWYALADEYRQSNLHQASDIPRKLREIGMYIAPEDPMNGRQPVLSFDVKDVETLARIEHDRFVAERMQAGWRQGNRSLGGRTTPFLVPWDDLPHENKELDRNAIRVLPVILAPLGYAIYRLDPL